MAALRAQKFVPETQLYTKRKFHNQHSSDRVNRLDLHVQTIQITIDYSRTTNYSVTALKVTLHVIPATALQTILNIFDHLEALSLLQT